MAKDNVQKVILFTNGHILAFTLDDCLILRREQDKAVLLDLLKNGERFFISKWAEWTHEISREEFAALTGVNYG